MDQASYLKNLSSTLFELSKANILCDTTLIASNREFSAHSVILAAASPTLRSAFQNSPDVKNMYRLELHWLDGNTLESVLFLIYTGNLKPSDGDKDKDDSANLIMTCEQLGLDWIWSQVDLAHNKLNKEESPPETLNDMAGHSSSSTYQKPVPSPDLPNPSLTSHTMAEVEPINSLCSSDARESLDLKDFNIDMVKSEGPATSTEYNSLCLSIALKDGNELETLACEFCDEVLPNVEQLNSHHQSCSMDHAALSCGECGHHLKCPNALEKHYKLHHAHDVESAPSVCHICGLVSDELRTHLTEAHGVASELLGCDMCGAVFGGSAELESHFKVSHADEQNEKPFVCSHCWKSFREKSQLKKHLLVHESRKDFVCELCSRSFAQEYYLKKHQRTHSDSLDHTCPTCGKKFKLLDYLRVHLKGHCAGEEMEDSTATMVGHQPHVCSVCNRRFSHLSYLKKHLRVHTGEKPYECVTCKKRFKDNCLQQHMLTHSSERPYACQKCDRRFLRQADLQAHVRTHSGMKSHWCTHCVQGFHKKGDLHRHLRIHTGERPYICETCGKSFKILFHLTLHAAVHSNDRPHKCDKCGRAFPSAVRLKKHAFIHTGERPYVCPVCSREFNRHANMKSHLKTHDEKPARPRGGATESENGDFATILDTRENVAESTLTRSENMEIVYCKMEQPEVLVALPIDTLQKYAL